MTATSSKSKADARVDDLPSFVRLIAQLSRDLGAIARVMPRLIVRRDIPVAVDGYPTLASGGVATAAGSSMPEPQLDDAAGTVQWRCGVRGCTTTGQADTATHAQLSASVHWREEHDTTIDYSDPAGRAAAELADTRGYRPDPVAATVRSIWHRLRRAAADVALAGEMARNLTTPRDIEAEPEDDIWCVSHARIDRLEQVSFHRDGTRRYQRRCRFCGDFKAAWGIEVPVDLLELKESRHNGRLSKDEVEQAIARAELDRAEQRTSKKKRRKR
jgi:hypothetical protein